MCALIFLFLPWLALLSLTERQALESNAEIADFVIAGGRPDQAGLNLPLAMRSLMVECWSPHASARPSFGECCTALRKFA